MGLGRTRNVVLVGLVALAYAGPAHASSTVAAAGDIACDTTSDYFNGGAGVEGHCRQQRTSDLLVGAGFTAVLTVGDNQYHVGSLGDFNASFDPSWGRVKPIIHPAVGDHEYSTAGARGYYDYFNGVGGQTGQAGDRDKGYYSFDIGSWHLIALNSACEKIDPGGAPNGCAASSPQERWLRADLAGHRSSCTLAYWHAPLFNSGFKGNSPVSLPLWQALYEAGADVVLNGDAHDYERFAPQDPSGRLDPGRGVREFVVGTGGAFFTGWSTLKTNSEIRQNNTFGVLALTLNPATYEWRFVPEQGKTFSDYGAGTCHGRPAGFDAAPPPKASAPAGGCTIRGTNRNDRLRGTAGRDVICGLAGNDRIRGLAGNDLVRGGRGRDRVSGGRGDDLIRGQSGNDRLAGGRGYDRIYGDRGNDTISARDHRRDRVYGGKGRDRAKLDKNDRARSIERRLAR